MLQNPRKTLDFKKNMVYKIPPQWPSMYYPAQQINVIYILPCKTGLLCIYSCTKHVNFASITPDYVVYITWIILVYITPTKHVYDVCITPLNMFIMYTLP